MMNLKVSIIILNWNNRKDIVECLDSVYRIDYANFNVIVVDNASSDGSEKDIIRLFPKVILIKNKENLGYTGGNNVGIRYALTHGAEYFWLLNNDTIVNENSLSALVNTAEASSRLGLLSPVIYYYSSPDKIQYCGSFLSENDLSRNMINNLCDFSRIKGEKLPYLWGTALLIKKSVVEKIGFLNEDFFAYAEDVEYSLRALNAGFLNSVVLNSKIFHKAHYKDKGVKNLSPHIYYYTVRNDYLLAKLLLSKLKRIKFVHKWCIENFRSIASFKEENNSEIVDALLDGMYCSFINKYGRKSEKKQMPRILKKILLWHPYFISDLMAFDGRKITKTLLRRLS